MIAETTAELVLGSMAEGASQGHGAQNPMSDACQAGREALMLWRRVANLSPGPAIAADTLAVMADANALLARAK